MKQKNIAVLIAYGLMVLWFYLWTSSASFYRPLEFSFSKALGQRDSNYHFRGAESFHVYKALTKNFLAGQLHLLNTCPYPYNAPRYNNCCYHILVQSRIDYFSAAAMPYEWVEYFAGSSRPYFWLIAFACLSKLLWLIKKIFFGRTSFWAFVLTIVFVSTANALLHILRDIEMHQVPIAYGNALLALSLCLFAKDQLTIRRSLPRLLLMSLSAAF